MSLSKRGRGLTEILLERPGYLIGEIRLGRGCRGGGIACAARREVGRRGNTRVGGYGVRLNESWGHFEATA